MNTRWKKIVRQRLWRKQRGMCHLCGTRMIHFSRIQDVRQPRGATIDHILPLARGGSGEVSNLALACRCCNEAKADSLVFERQEAYA